MPDGASALPSLESPRRTEDYTDVGADTIDPSLLGDSQG